MITDDTTARAARTTADTIADRLSTPEEAQRLPLVQGWMPQSLAYGPVGVALLHIERARTGHGPWDRAHAWLACAASSPVSGGLDSHLFHGAPALAFALNLAAEGTRRYGRALNVLDEHVNASVRRRLDGAHARIDQRQLPALAEFDGIRGLSGLAAVLMARDHTDDVLIRQILSYLVRLTEPLTDGDEYLPGWWSDLAPSGKTDRSWPGGHGNNGVAHGIGGPLTVLSHAALRGLLVEGHADAIRRICNWLDQWRQDGPTGPWWPYVITRDHLQGRAAFDRGPLRPSWCYGTAGLARAQQLAALALGDISRQRMAENALLYAVTDPDQLARVVDSSLCHGFAGLAHIVQSAAAAALSPGELTAVVPELIGLALREDPVGSLLPASGTADIGFLEGATGVALALYASLPGPQGSPSWNSSLLIT
ncbi:lanthionine synthetase C family protein [Streptomyces sp. NPDC093249]|uniref:lanthionine synthetase C family protein n=1 Tax=unclassified Streptomyces TaxID=2593676 RepID=UPI00344D564D